VSSEAEASGEMPSKDNGFLFKIVTEDSSAEIDQAD